MKHDKARATGWTKIFHKVQKICKEYLRESLFCKSTFIKYREAVREKARQTTAADKVT